MVTTSSLPAEDPEENHGEPIKLTEDQNASTNISTSLPLPAHLQPWLKAQKQDKKCRAWAAYLLHQQLPRVRRKAISVIAQASFMYIDEYGLIRALFPAHRKAQGGDLEPVLVVPASKQDKVLQEGHDSAFSGHHGVIKTFQRIAATYWFPGMYSAVKRYVSSCDSCNKHKVGKHGKAEMRSIPVGGPWHRLGIDIVGPLPITAGGMEYILVFVDYLTKWSEAFAIRKANASTVAQFLVEEVICRHGCPEEILTDRGSAFLNEVITSVNQLLTIRHVHTSAWHPQTDGLTEKTNGTLVTMLRHYVETRGGKDWDLYLPYVLLAYRTSVHSSTGFTPSNSPMVVKLVFLPIGPPTSQSIPDSPTPTATYGFSQKEHELDAKQHWKTSSDRRPCSGSTTTDVCNTRSPQSSSRETKLAFAGTTSLSSVSMDPKGARSS